MDQAALSIHSHVELHAQVPLVPLPGLLHLCSRSLFRFFVELGASMMLASTIVPSLRITPSSARCSLDHANNFHVPLTVGEVAGTLAGLAGVKFGINQARQQATRVLGAEG